MLLTVGDLVEDVVVRVDDPINVASDTTAVISRRRGGSAANVAEAAARRGHAVRFVGRVGDDAVGRALVEDLAAAGVDTSCVTAGGRTGTILVLVDPAGERSMLTDRGAAVQLDRPDALWLDDVATLHVPMYSLVGDPLATTTRTLIRWAHERSIDVTIDLSSVALIEAVTPAAVVGMLDELRPAVVFANRDEADALGNVGAVGAAITVVKHGPEPAIVLAAEGAIEVPVDAIDVGDTTGAGDAFAGGFVTSDWRNDPLGAARSGHRAAAAHLLGR